MHYQRTFVSPSSCEICKSRAKRLLEFYGFRLTAETNLMEFERSYQGAGLVSVNPRSVFTKLVIWFTEEGEGCSVLVTEIIQKFGQPASALDKAFWAAELSDLEELLVHCVNPAQDRRLQNSDAGRLSLAVMVAMIVVIAVVLLIGFRIGATFLTQILLYVVGLAPLLLVYTLAPMKLKDRSLADRPNFL